MASGKIEEKRFHQYSPSFYQKERELNNVITRAKLGFSHLDKNDKILKPRTLELFLKFNELPKSGQRECLREDT